VRPIVEGPAWLGDTLHVSQGLAVRTWHAGTSSLEIDLDLGRKAEGRVWLALPGPATNSSLGRRPVAWEPCSTGVYATDLSIDGAERLKVEW